MKDVDWDEIEHVRGTCILQAEALSDLMMTILATITLELQERMPYDKTLHAFIEKYEMEYKHTLGKAEDALQNIAYFLSCYERDFWGSICIDPMPPRMIKVEEESNKDLMKIEIDTTE